VAAVLVEPLKYAFGEICGHDQAKSPLGRKVPSCAGLMGEIAGRKGTLGAVLSPVNSSIYCLIMAALFGGRPRKPTHLEYMMAERKATVERNTLETQITASVNLDGTGAANFDTGVPFLEHMLDQIARHGLIDLDITAKGDLHIDDHHTVEDIGITLGQAFSQAIADK